MIVSYTKTKGRIIEKNIKKAINGGYECPFLRGNEIGDFWSGVEYVYYCGEDDHSIKHFQERLSHKKRKEYLNKIDKDCPFLKNSREG